MYAVAIPRDMSRNEETHPPFSSAYGVESWPRPVTRYD